MVTDNIPTELQRSNAKTSLVERFRDAGRGSPIMMLCLFNLMSAYEAPAQNTRDLALESIGGRRRVALVIGNAAYRSQPLANPTHDAEDMKSALQAVGFTVTIGTDLSFQRMQAQIARFIEDVKNGDTALFYYSGHGMQIDGENLLVPADFVMESEDKAKAACVHLDGVQRLLEKSGASLSVLIVDACRTNPFRRSRAWGRGLAPAEAGLGTYIVFSASPGQIADDNPEERNGLFTKFLIEGLRQPPPLSQLFRSVRDSVHRASAHAQTPFVQDQVIGDFYFTRLGTAGPRPAAVRETPDQMERLDRATRLYHQGNCAEAAAQFELAVRANPENALAQNASGVAYTCQKLYAQAIQRFNMAIQLKPDMAAAYHNRGSLYMISGRYDLALDDFTWAIEQQPENSQNYTRRGDANFRLRKYEEALTDFDRAMSLNPSDAEAYYGRGQVCQRQGRFREALDAYDGAIARKAEFREAVQDRAALARRMRR